MKKYYLILIALIIASASYAQTVHNVTVQSNSFTPANLTIVIGDTVVWTNIGGNHNVNGTTATYPSNPASFGNGVGTGWTYSYVFDTAGNYDYRCDPHFGAGMFGTVTVLVPDSTNDDWITNGSVTSTLSNVSIGTATPATGYTLSVAGAIICEELQVLPNGSWPDYVFDKNYNLLSLKELENYIALKKHLPGVPSAGSVKDEGISVGGMTKIMIEKIEELTLYVIEQSKRLKEQNEKLSEQSDQIIDLQKENTELRNSINN